MRKLTLNIFNSYAIWIFSFQMKLSDVVYRDNYCVANGNERKGH